MTLLWLLLFPLSAQAAPLKVVASFSILGDMTREIAGDQAEITTLVAPESDAHAFEPTPASVKTLAQANLFIVNGLGFESWAERSSKAAGYKGVTVIASKGIAPQQFEEDGTQITDLHAWQNLANGKIYAANIRDALIAADPAHATHYKHNAERYIAEMEALDRWVKQQFAAIPKEHRRVITTHDAFGYFGKAYGVEFIAPLGLSTDSQPSAATMAQLIDQIRTNHVRALFIETISDPRLMQQLERDAKAHIGGELYSDALSKPDGPAPTYLAMFKHNVTALVKGMK